MNELIDAITPYLAMWMPAITAVFGVVFTVIKAVRGSVNAVNELRNSAEFAELTKKVVENIKENQALREQNALLLDQITKIQNYVEEIKKEKANKGV